jgi:uncharacterized repeat protein (TIGR01451 family)
MMKKNDTILKVVLLMIALLGSSILLYKVTASADRATSYPKLIRLARLSDSSSIRSNARVTASINFSDGHDLLTYYEGPDRARAFVQDNLASPTALASADFDEDGVPDLICAYRAPEGGIITLHRGNQDAIYPDSPQAQRRKIDGEFTDAPFISPAKVFELPQAPDFVGVGDFDANGHQDMVFASRESNALFLLEGDGHAGFSATRRIELPGAVTALATGDVNRADGIAEIVIGILAVDGPKALVYETLKAASRAISRVFSLPSQATALAMEKLDDDYLVDFAVAAGREVLVFYGQEGNKEKQARSSKRRFASDVRSIVTGNFINRDKSGLAVLTNDGKLHLLDQSEAKNKNRKKSDQINQWKEQALVLSAHSAELVRARVSCARTDSLIAIDSAAHQIHIIADDQYAQKQNSASASRKIAVFDVEGSPVAALPIRLNRSALDNLVILRSGQTSPSVMMPQVMMTFTVSTIDDAGAGSLRVAIQNANANPGLDLIDFNIGVGPVTINIASPLGISDPVVIDANTQPGFAGSPIVELNGSGGAGTGLALQAGNTTVRGLVINRFVGSAITINGDNNLIQSNFIGTDITGTLDLGNALVGVDITNGLNNTIGGAAAGARNIISGNGAEGVRISNAGTTGNQVQGNFIGIDSSGTVEIHNGLAGVFINGAPGNTIGGAGAGARNILSGNADRGITIIGDGTIVQDNFIGTDASGTAILGNKLGGILIVGSNNLVGGTAAGALNVISGNEVDGVQVAGAGSSNNLIQGNFIGTDVSGTADLGNARLGVLISASATSNNVGGTSDAARNVISGNDGFGVQIATTGTSNNTVQGNFIGTDASGTAALGNSEGVHISLGASGNSIGGFASGAGNVIAFNSLNGITVEDAGGNSILSNSIFSNSLLGIDLGADGATPNDAGDIDAGANNLQNFPQLISATVSLGSTIIQGTFNSTPNTIFTLQFFSNTDCDDSGFGEGQQLIGTRTIGTDAGGNALINFSFPGQFGLPVTMTATDQSGNTSEFSKCEPDITGLDLAISKTASPGVVKPGDTLTYKITAVNNGSTPVSNVTVLDSLPSAVTFVSCSATGNGICLGSGNDRSVVFAALPAGASATITFVTTVKTPLPNGTIISNTATISSPAPEDNTTNNTTTTTVIVSDAPPAINCPGNIVRNANAGQCLAVVEYPLPTLNDTLLGATITCSPPSGSTFPAGITTVNCVARNEKGETGNCSFTITVNSPASARVTLENSATALSFGPAEAKRKTRKPPKGCDCDSTFTIENTGCAALNLALDSIMRTGTDVTSGKITDPDDSKIFSVKLINNNQTETDLAIGAVVSIPTGQTRSFRVLFKPGLPALTGKTTGLAAADVLPDLITSKITFKQNGIEPIMINLVGRISTDVRIIDPDDARASKRAVFTKSGNEFTISFGVFDADLNVNRAMFEFLDGNGQLVEQAFIVDLAQPISQNNIIKGQSFVITQKFTGAASHPEVASVRVQVSDPRSIDSVRASAASVQSLQNSTRRAVVLQIRKLP